MDNSNLYINELYASYSCSENDKERLQYPNLESIKQLIEDTKENKVDYLSLSNNDSYVSITVFAERGLYHIGIVDDENGQIYYYWNGMKQTSELVAIAGHYFPEHMICNYSDIFAKIIELFCKSGERLKEVKWICEEI